MKTPVINFLIITVVSFSLFSCNENNPVKPNIIYILADDLGYGDLGCYGQQQINTPNIDQLANEGIRFTDHYAGSTVCAPSRCCLMTGLHTGNARVRGNARVPLLPEDITVAELLKSAGYTTGLIGKWGLGEPGTTGIPNNQGFDYFFGYLNQARAHNYYPEWLWRNEEKVMLNNEVIFAETGYAKGIGSAATKKVNYSHDLFTGEALSFIERSKDQPFFLYLAYTIPHANNEHWLIDEHGMEVPDYGEYKDNDWPEAQIGTAAMISRMDRDIGQLISKLTEAGIDQNTVIFFTSDNGPHAEGLNDPDFFNSNGPLKGIKRDLNEGGIRVPFIAWWPGTIQEGQTSNHISAFWDFLPTVCDLAGIESPKNIDGISYAPTLVNQLQQEHKYLYWEFFEQGGKQAIRLNNWKGIRLGVNTNPDSSLYLYDLDNDIEENKELSDSQPDIFIEVSALMKTARTESEDFKFNHEK
ncbi:arylsulfatase [Bacteroidota bacterium]